jgi:hypothetical protein
MAQRREPRRLRHLPRGAAHSAAPVGRRAAPACEPAWARRPGAL